MPPPPAPDSTPRPRWSRGGHTGGGGRRTQCRSPIVAAPPLGGPVRPCALAEGEAVEGPPRARCHPEVGIDLMRGVERAPHEALLDLLSREAVGFLERRSHARRLGLGEPAEDPLKAGVVPAVVEALEGSRVHTRLARRPIDFCARIPLHSRVRGGKMELLSGDFAKDIADSSGGKEPQCGVPSVA
eukprot:scaffold6129_cov147-Isochrysis_galbana.AAC.2